MSLLLLFHGSATPSGFKPFWADQANKAVGPEIQPR